MVAILERVLGETWAERYRNAVSLIGWAVLLPMLSQLTLHENPAATVLFMLLAIIGNWVYIPLQEGALTIGFSVTLAAYLVLHPVTAMWLCVGGNLIGNGLLRRRPLAIACFNGAQLGLSMYVAHHLFLATGGLRIEQPINLLDNLPAILTFNFSFFVINYFLVSFYFKLLNPDSDWWSLLSENFRWDFLNHLAGAAIGFFVGLGYLQWGVTGSLLAFVPMLFIAYLFVLQRDLRNAHEELTLLYESGQRLNSALQMEDVMDLLTEIIGKVAKTDLCAVYLFKPNEDKLIPRLVFGQESREGDLPEVGLEEGIIGRVAKSQKEKMIPDVRKDRTTPPFVRQCGMRSLLLVPLTIEDELVGVLAVGNAEAHAFESSHLRLLSILSNQLAAALENAILYERSERLAVTDEMTGLYNYRYFYERLEREMDVSRSEDVPLALVYIDLDDFSQYNNSFGHPVGDQILRKFASILEESVRNTDIVVRYAGDEFVVILPRADRGQARAVVERLTQNTREAAIETDQGHVITNLSVSCGISVFPDDGCDADELVSAADKNMYEDKRSAS